jgi:hypothetical protein
VPRSSALSAHSQWGQVSPSWCQRQQKGICRQARHTPLNLTSASLEELVGLHARLCLSLYMGTHRSHPDNQQDPVRFRHLVGALSRSSSDTSSDRQQTAHSSVSSYGGLGAGHSAMHHGQGGKKDGMDSEVERFFRAVDRAVQAHHSDVSGLPLMLAALPEHHHLFQTISHNPRLMKQGLLINPDSLSPTELQQRAWARWLRNQAAKCMFWRPSACPQPRVLRRVIATEAAKPHPCHS